MNKVYIITETDLKQHNNYIYAVYSKKDYAKRMVDRLNEIADYDEKIYSLSSYNLEEENESDYFTNS